MDVATWLHTLGLGQYAAAFREHDIDADLLPKLTAEDFRDLGVESVGHRRQLLNAAVAIRAASAAPPWDAVPERRLVTVMFCDMIGATALSSRLDPEELNEIIRAYQARVKEQVALFGGYVARYVGDGVLVYFGWPENHETDAERAVRAGLAVIRAVASAPIRDETIEIRIGIATGLVVIGEAIGDGDSRQQTAVGETPNRAARLQGLAAANSATIDAVTQRQIGDMFGYLELGEVELKGFPEPIPVWQVLGERTGASRFEALHGGDLLPMIGREEQLGLILEKWRQAQGGEGQVVLLSGEAGIGKSRLIAALEERLVAEPHTALRYFCSPHYTEHALYPVVARWEQEAGFSHNDTIEQRFDKLEAFLRPQEASPRDKALIADLLGFPSGSRYPPLLMSPKEKHDHTIEMLMRRMGGSVQSQPLLVLVEDLHWADQSSLDLMDKIVAQLPASPVLLVASFRPEFTAPWVGQLHVVPMALDRLDQQESTALAAQVPRATRLPAALLRRIVAQADGVPLFLEELTKAMLETTGTHHAPLSLTIVPKTLQASLTARLDRLPAAKQVAQIGAAIGREFPLALLAAAAGLSDARLSRGLEQLVASGLVFRRGLMPDVVYRFKHALVQDAAYQTMLLVRRRSLHRHLAAIIPTLLPDIVHAQPEILARHYEGAEQYEKASICLIAAGDNAEGRFARAEAAILYRQALDALKRLTPTDAMRRLMIDTTIKLTDAGILSGDPNEHFARMQAVEALVRTLAHASQTLPEDRMRQAKVNVWLGRALHNLNRLPEALQYYQAVINMGETPENESLVGITLGLSGRIRALQGRFADSVELISRAIPILERHGNAVHFIPLFAFWGTACGARGDFVAGLELVERSKQLATAYNTVIPFMFSIGIAAMICQHSGNFRGMAESSLLLIEMAEQNADRLFAYQAHARLGWALAMSGTPDIGLEHFRRAWDIRDSVDGPVILRDQFTAMRAEVLFLAGRPADALREAQHAVTLAAAVDAPYSEGLARRVWASALMALDAANWPAAECQLRASLSAFEAGDARVEAARTHAAWARLDIHSDSAHEHLSMAREKLTSFGLTDELRATEEACAGIGRYLHAAPT